jgi:hypothetical protein
MQGGPDLHPDARLIVGLKINRFTPGDLVVRLESMASGLHTHVRDPEAIVGLWTTWHGATGHLTTRVPLSALCDCDEGKRS